LEFRHIAGIIGIGPENLKMWGKEPREFSEAEFFRFAKVLIFRKHFQIRNGSTVLLSLN